MGIRTKFNIALFAVFAFGFAAAWFYLERQFVEAARAEVLQNARIMLSAANAVRGYTVREVRPLVEQVQSGRFEPTTVPSYAAQTNFRA
ncbi:MAG TPA: signal protein, partial [Acetobacteraceae bacterium]|nr:signal protein [Acetobacteraceae bacterium]